MPGNSDSRYETEVAGWSEWEMPGDTLWYEVPIGDTIQDHANPDNVEGVWVHASNPDDPGDEHWFWVRTYMQLDWDQWDDLIWNAMDQCNMAMA